MFCKNCGKENPDGANHCKYCGVQLNENLKKNESGKKGKTVLIVIIAVLVVAVLALVGVFVVKPYIEGDNSGSSQSEEKDDRDDKKDDDDKDKSEEETLAEEETQDDEILEAIANEAETEMLSYVNDIFVADVEDVKMLLTDNAGADSSNTLALDLLGTVRQYCAFGVVSYEVVDEETVVFEVEIDTIDYFSVMETYIDLVNEYINTKIDSEGRVPTEDEMWEVTLLLFYEAFNNYNYSGKTISSTQSVTMIKVGDEWEIESGKGFFDGIFFGLDEARETAGESLDEIMADLG